MRSFMALTTLSLAATLCAPAFAEGTSQARPETGRPGTVNYVEGQATLNGQPLAANSRAELGLGQTIATIDGKAEILLTPGVFLRLGDNTSLTMVSPDLTKTEVQLNSGHAEVEVDQIYKQNDLLIDSGPTQTKLLDHGLYAFDANASTLRVFDGKAAVSPSQDATKWETVKAGHQLALNGSTAKTTSFDRKDIAASDPLYNWGKLRSEYLGEANVNLAREYAGVQGFYPGWFWDPGLYAYTWLPGDGLFWSPFGYGFYSPYYIGAGGFIYPGYVNRGYRGGLAVRSGYSGYSGPAARGFATEGARGGFHGGGGRR